jgi:DNA mismatch repair protein MutH
VGRNDELAIGEISLGKIGKVTNQHGLFLQLNPESQTKNRKKQKNLPEF